MPKRYNFQDIDPPDRIRLGIVVVLTLTVLLATAATYFGSSRLFENQVISVARSQHALYLRSLNEAIKQHQHLPFVLSQNPRLTERIARGDGKNLNETLDGFADASGLEAIYVMALDGQVVATSNFAHPDSFLGQNYGFRPYFQEAIEGSRSDYFAIGVTTGRPGYFVAEPLRSTSGDLIGVVAIKLDVSELQTSWEERGENVLVTNQDGVVVLSSNPNWLYRTITDLDEDRRAEILRSRQFADEPLDRVSWDVIEGGKIDLQGQLYHWISGKTELVGLTVHYMAPQALVRRQTLLATGLLGSVIALLIGFAAFLRSRRIAAALAASLRHRKALIKINGQLLKTQDELAKTSKLAALGQLAASVTHELGQPISALKNHLLAAEMGNEITSAETLDNFRRLTARMEAITKQLRFFAQRNLDEKRPTDILSVFREALALLQHDLDAAQVDVTWTSTHDPCIVMGDQLQLEQAMINLLRNALQASEKGRTASISLEFRATDDTVVVDVLDNGPGLNGLSLDELQEPFFSTKSSGVGMGLGLAITAEIIRTHGGTMSARDRPDGGAIFTITLPATREALT